MAGALKYNKIIKYSIFAECKEPLHIGNAVGDKEEVLIHPVDNVPFIQASSISGVFRAYHLNAGGIDRNNKLFGARNVNEGDNSYDYSSLLRFSDGVFLSEDKVLLELRPRVSINRETGSVMASKVKGSGIKAGHKFNMEYIGAGARFQFSMYLYDNEYVNDVEDILAALAGDSIQLGGQKSNGCGYIKLINVHKKEFDMTKAEGRAAWSNEYQLPTDEYQDITDNIINLGVKAGNAYHITVVGKTENMLQVKSICVSDYGKGAPDSMNITNAKKEYIIPGSSFKGAIRNQMEKIATYLGKDSAIDRIFGKKASKDNTGTVGNISFLDTVVGDIKKNDMMDINYRIHIDKFTGGVFQRGLFSEKNVAGDVCFNVTIADRNNPDEACGLLLMALRDMAIGTVSLGGGYNIGKGFISVEKIKVVSPKGEAIIDYVNKTIDNEDLINDCIKAAKAKEV